MRLPFLRKALGIRSHSAGSKDSGEGTPGPAQEAAGRRRRCLHGAPQPADRHPGAGEHRGEGDLHSGAGRYSGHRTSQPVPGRLTSGDTRKHETGSPAPSGVKKAERRDNNGTQAESPSA